jgi:restriction endonuclease Mrr
MAVPDFQRLMLPLLKLAGDGQQHTYAEAVEQLAQEFQLSDDDRAQLLRSGQTRLQVFHGNTELGADAKAHSSDPRA